VIELSDRVVRRRRRRDRLATVAVVGAAGTVLAAILLMFLYLLYTCLPLIATSAMGERERSVEMGRMGAVRATDGSLWALPLPPSFTGKEDPPPVQVPSSGNRAVLATAGALHVYRLAGRTTEGGSSRVGEGRWQQSLSPASAPRGPIVLDDGAGELLLAFYAEDGALWAYRVREGAAPDVAHWRIAAPQLASGTLLVDAASSQVLVVRGNRFLRWQLPSAGVGGEPIVFGGQLAGIGEPATAVGWGPGRESLLVATEDAQLHRFDLARPGLARLGSALPLPQPLRWIGSERQRRVAALIDRQGKLTLLVPSTGETLLRADLGLLSSDGKFGISADGAFLYQAGREEVSRWRLHNPSPQTSARSLWTRHAYPAYEEPSHVWHPDGPAIGTLPKYGLSPLLWGTFKAALYGMVFAVPLALGAAIYTGYFLPPRQRNRIKPAIEMLEAFPTVVLGFIAGLWLAPRLGDALFIALVAPLLLVLVPLVLAAVHLVVQRISFRFVGRPPRVAIVTLAYVATGLLFFAQADGLESLLFGGDIESWFWRTLGLPYEQRNALLVGLAMGLAVMPVMFSIVEDAINVVPRSLSDGSLALGATRWQALRRVVLPAAAPAILSALLIGLARGLGETMIVLLASGNAPVMEADILSGLRSLAANIAIELPEADTDSTHFRLLFLGALVLFTLTFALNTVAEVFRQRLRYAYAGH